MIVGAYDQYARDGYAGRPAPDEDDETNLAYLYWKVGQRLAVEAGKLPPPKPEQSIKVTTDKSIRVNYTRLMHHY